MGFFLDQTFQPARMQLWGHDCQSICRVVLPEIWDDRRTCHRFGLCSRGRDQTQISERREPPRSFGRTVDGRSGQNCLVGRKRDRSKIPHHEAKCRGIRTGRCLAQLRSSTPGTFDQVNLSSLICGSEGTLALIERAEVHLVKAPERTELLLASFADVDQACDALLHLVATNPAAVELIDANVIQAAKSQGGFSTILDKLPADGALVYLEYHDQSTEPAEALLRQRGIDSHKPVDGTEAKLFWRLRKEGLGLIGKPSEGKMPIAGFEDCAIPLERYATFRRAFSRRLEREQREAVWYAHASVGLLHVRPRFDLREEMEQEHWESLAQDLTQLVMEHGGTVSGEHGDGRIRAKMVHDMLGPQIMEAIRKIKQVFDPGQRLNPGNIVEPRPALVPLRIDGRHQPLTEPEVTTFGIGPKDSPPPQGRATATASVEKKPAGPCALLGVPPGKNVMPPAGEATRCVKRSSRDQSPISAILIFCRRSIFVCRAKLADTSAPPILMSPNSKVKCWPNIISNKARRYGPSCSAAFAHCANRITLASMDQSNSELARGAVFHQTTG